MIKSKYWYYILTEWHHLYLGIVLIISYYWINYDPVLFLGIIITIDDAMQHFWQGFGWYNTYLELEQKGGIVSIDHRVGVYYWTKFAGDRITVPKPHSPLHYIYQSTLAKIPFIVKFNMWLDKLLGRK